MKRALVIVVLFAGCAVRSQPSVQSEREPTLEELDTSLDNTLQAAGAVDCDRASQLRDAICTMAKRLCVVGDEKERAARCEEGKGRCDKAKGRVEKNCVSGAVNSPSP